MVKLDKLQFGLDYNISRLAELSRQPPLNFGDREASVYFSDITQGERTELAALHK